MLRRRVLQRLGAGLAIGLLAAFDLSCNCLWRDGLVATIGALAVNGSGDRIVLACYSEGLRFYNATGVAADNAGNLFVADFRNHTIRKITPAGWVSTFAGLAATIPGRASSLRITSR